MQGNGKIMDKLVGLGTAPACAQVVSRSDCHARNSRAELAVIAERDSTWAKGLQQNIIEIVALESIQVRIQIADMGLVSRIRQLVRERDQRRQLWRGGTRPAYDVPPDAHAWKACVNEHTA